MSVVEDGGIGSELLKGFDAGEVTSGSFPTVSLVEIPHGSVDGDVVVCSGPNSSNGLLISAGRLALGLLVTNGPLSKGVCIDPPCSSGGVVGDRNGVLGSPVCRLSTVKECELLAKLENGSFPNTSCLGEGSFCSVLSFT
jgi:hypothetical protein